MKRVVSLIVVSAALLASSTAFASTPDVVRLKGGGRVQGVIRSDDPQTGVTVKLADGSTRVIKRARIASVVYGDDTSRPAAALALPPAPVATPMAAVAAPAPVAAPAAVAPAPVAAAPVAAAPVAAAPAVPVAVTHTTSARMRARAHDDEGDDDDGESAHRPAPEGMHYENRSRRGMWATGLALTLGVWGIRAGVTLAICQNPGDGKTCEGRDYGGAATPIVGAWWQLSRGLGDHGGNTPAEFGALLACGVVETAGVVLFVSGLASSHRVLVEGPREDASLKVGPLRVLPSVGLRSAGVVGTF